MKDPKTAAEWQEAVDAAYVMRMIADCVMYGLVQTDAEINIERCDWILAEGKRLGYEPTRKAIEKALGGKS